MSTSGVAVTNWAGNVTFRAQRVHRPAGLAELGRIVAEAEHVRALGTGHSFNLIADTEADLVRLDGLPAEIEIDAAKQQATVSAGLRYAEVARRLHESGFALANLASLPHISVAGSVATGTHGSGLAQPGLGSAVTGLRFLRPDGDTAELSRAADPDTFPGAVVALGALGIVTHLTLALEPTFSVAQRTFRDVPLVDIGAGFEEIFGAAYSVSAFTTWTEGTATVWLKHRTDQPEPTWAGAHPSTEPVHPIMGMPTRFATQQLDVPGPWHERLPHFRPEFTPSAGEELQSEFFLPRAAAGQAIAALGEIGALMRPLLQVTEIRTVRGSDLWLDPAHQRDSVTFHFTWVKDPDAVRPVLGAVESALVSLGARPHWGKVTNLPGPQVIAGYERAADFAALRRDLDPDRKFGNSFVDELFG